MATKHALSMNFPKRMCILQFVYITAFSRTVNCFENSGFLIAHFKAGLYTKCMIQLKWQSHRSQWSYIEHSTTTLGRIGRISGNIMIEKSTGYLLLCQCLEILDSRWQNDNFGISSFRCHLFWSPLYQSRFWKVKMKKIQTIFSASEVGRFHPLYSLPPEAPQSSGVSFAGWRKMFCSVLNSLLPISFLVDMPASWFGLIIA